MTEESEYRYILSLTDDEKRRIKESLDLWDFEDSEEDELENLNDMLDMLGILDYDKDEIIIIRDMPEMSE